MTIGTGTHRIEIEFSFFNNQEIGRVLFVVENSRKGTFEAGNYQIFPILNLCHAHYEGTSFRVVYVELSLSGRLLHHEEEVRIKIFLVGAI